MFPCQHGHPRSTSRDCREREVPYVAVSPPSLPSIHYRFCTSSRLSSCRLTVFRGRSPGVCFFPVFTRLRSRLPVPLTQSHCDSFTNMAGTNLQDGTRVIFWEGTASHLPYPPRGYAKHMGHHPPCNWASSRHSHLSRLLGIGNRMQEHGT